MIKKNQIILLITLIIPMVLFAAQIKQVNIFNWSGYIPNAVLIKFKQETGIRVNYSTYDSNEMLYNKLKSNKNMGYDVVVPSSYVIQRMVKEGMLQKLDYSRLQGVNNLDASLLNKAFDPQNHYSLPYLWGTTGLIVNASVYPKGGVKAWKDLWQARFYHQVSLVNDVRDVFAIGLISLGYSINDRKPQHLKAAYDQLKKLMPNVLSFSADGSQQMYVNEDANIGMINSGDALMVMAENVSFYFIYPKDRQIVWVDNMAIPNNAPHLDEAYQFINFILRPDVAKMIAENIGYSTPNQAAIRLMSSANQSDVILNPTAKELSNAEVEADIGVEANRLMLKYWELLKLGA